MKNLYPGESRLAIATATRRPERVAAQHQSPGPASCPLRYLGKHRGGPVATERAQYGAPHTCHLR